MRKCKGCESDCLFCVDASEMFESIDTKGAFLFWPSVVIAVIAIAAWWLS
jgi:hypothetical protein